MGQAYSVFCKSESMPCVLVCGRQDPHYEMPCSTAKSLTIFTISRLTDITFRSKSRTFPASPVPRPVVAIATALSILIWQRSIRVCAAAIYSGTDGLDWPLVAFVHEARPLHAECALSCAGNDRRERRRRPWSSC